MEQVIISWDPFFIIKWTESSFIHICCVKLMLLLQNLCSFMDKSFLLHQWCLEILMRELTMLHLWYNSLCSLFVFSTLFQIVWTNIQAMLDCTSQSSWVRISSWKCAFQPRHIDILPSSDVRQGYWISIQYSFGQEVCHPYHDGWLFDTIQIVFANI